MAKNDDPSKGSGPGDEREEPVVRDKRRIDPETGKVRQPEGDAAEPNGSAAEAAGSSAGSDERLEHEQVVDTGEGSDGETLSDDELAFLSGQSNAEELAAERIADLQRVDRKSVV